MPKTTKKNYEEPPQESPVTPLFSPPEPPPPEIEPDPPPIQEETPSAPGTAPDQPIEEQAGDRTEAEPFKRRPGRPRKDDPPINRSDIITRINNLDSWEATRVYVYRWEPYHDRKVGGRQSVSVKRYEGPFDEQDMLEDPGLGSGVYELIVNRTDPQTRQRRVIDSGIVKLLNMKFPPRIPKGEWVDDPRNKEWEWARNLCDKTEIPAPVEIKPPMTSETMLLNLMEKQNERQHAELMAVRSELQKALTKQPDPGPTNMLLEVLKPLLPLVIAKLTESPKSDETQALFMKYLMDQANKQQQPAAAVDPLAGLDKILDLEGKLRDRFGKDVSVARSRKTGWQEVITEIAGPAAELLKPFAQLIATGMILKAQQLQQQPQQQQSGMPAQQQQFEPPALPAPGPQLVKQDDAPKQPTIEAIAQALLDHIHTKKVGLDLGDWYLEEYGQRELDEIMGQGKEKLIEDLRATPQWNFLMKFKQTGELDTILDEFMAWEPERAAEEDAKQEAAAEVKIDWNQEAPAHA